MLQLAHVALLHIMSHTNYQTELLVIHVKLIPTDPNPII